MKFAVGICTGISLDLLFIKIAIKLRIKQAPPVSFEVIKRNFISKTFYSHMIDNC